MKDTSLSLVVESLHPGAGDLGLYSQWELLGRKVLSMDMFLVFPILNELSPIFLILLSCQAGVLLLSGEFLSFLRFIVLGH